MHKSLQKTSKLVLVIFIFQSWHYNTCTCICRVPVIENICKLELDVLLFLLL